MSRRVAVLVDMFASRKETSEDILGHHSLIQAFFEEKGKNVGATRFGDELLVVVKVDDVDLSEMLIEFQHEVKELRTCAAAGLFECDEEPDSRSGLEPLALRHAIEDLQQVMVCVPPGHLLLLGSFEDRLTDAALTWVEVRLTEDGPHRPIRLASFASGEDSLPNLDPHALVTACIQTLSGLMDIRADLSDSGKEGILTDYLAMFADADDQSPASVVRNFFRNDPARLGYEIRSRVRTAMKCLRPFATASAPGVRKVCNAVEALSESLEAEVSRFAKTSPEKAFKAMEYNKSGQMYSIVGELKEICMSMVDGSIAQVSSLLTASRHGIMATVEPTSADA